LFRFFADAYLADHREELIADAKGIVDRWQREGFFGKVISFGGTQSGHSFMRLMLHGLLERVLAPQRGLESIGPVFRG
jgi:hypothetical protein